MRPGGHARPHGASSGVAASREVSPLQISQVHGAQSCPEPAQASRGQTCSCRRVGTNGYFQGMALLLAFFPVPNTQVF